MKCPACGFETPEEQGYCDFCKEPFRPAKAAAPQAEPGAAPPPSPKEQVPKEVLRKLREQRILVGEEKKLKADIPPEFADLDTGGEIPEVSPYVRKLAWVFFGLCLLWVAIVTLLMLWKGREIVRKPAMPVAAPTAGDQPKTTF